jgi:hypothetical protein
LGVVVGVGPSHAVPLDDSMQPLDVDGFVVVSVTGFEVVSVTGLLVDVSVDVLDVELELELVLLVELELLVELVELVADVLEPSMPLFALAGAAASMLTAVVASSATGMIRRRRMVVPSPVGLPPFERTTGRPFRKDPDFTARCGIFASRREWRPAAGLPRRLQAVSDDAATVA